MAFLAPTELLGAGLTGAAANAISDNFARKNATETISGDVDFTGAISIAGVVRTAALSTAPAAVAAGYKIARGETALDGGNPTPVAHGLTTCIAFSATLKGTAAPGVGTSSLSANINGANVDVYAWKVTTSTDNTLIASGGTESFYWVAVGT